MESTVLRALQQQEKDNRIRLFPLRQQLYAWGCYTYAILNESPNPNRWKRLHLQVQLTLPLLHGKHLNFDWIQRANILRQEQICRKDVIYLVRTLFTHLLKKLRNPCCYKSSHQTLGVALAGQLWLHSWGNKFRLSSSFYNDVIDEAGEPQDVPQLERHCLSIRLNEKRCSPIQLSSKEWDPHSTSLPPMVRQASSTIATVRLTAIWSHQVECLPTGLLAIGLNLHQKAPMWVQDRPVHTCRECRPVGRCCVNNCMYAHMPFAVQWCGYTRRQSSQSSTLQQSPALIISL